MAEKDKSTPSESVPFQTSRTAMPYTGVRPFADDQRRFLRNSNSVSKFALQKYDLNSIPPNHASRAHARFLTYDINNVFLQKFFFSFFHSFFKFCNLDITFYFNLHGINVYSHEKNPHKYSQSTIILCHF